MFIVGADALDRQGANGTLVCRPARYQALS